MIRKDYECGPPLQRSVLQSPQFGGTPDGLNQTKTDRLTTMCGDLQN
jgi:hypothetical protein